MPPGELKIRLRLDTGDAKRERDSFLSGFGGAFGGAAAAGVLGAPGAFLSRTASTALGTTLSTVVADVVEGPLAAARVMGRVASRESGYRAFAERTRAFFNAEDEVKESLGMAARGMSLEQIRAFSAPLLDLRRQQAEGALRVEEALEGNGGFAKEIAGGDPALQALLENGEALAKVFGELLEGATRLAGLLASLPFGR